MKRKKQKEEKKVKERRGFKVCSFQQKKAHPK